MGLEDLVGWFCGHEEVIVVSNRTRRVLIGAGLGILPGVLVIVAAVVVELAVESGGGMFGIVGIPLAVVGLIIGAALGAAKPETLRNPQLGAVLGAVPGLLIFPAFGILAVPVILIGGWIGYMLARRARRHAPAEPIAH
jgi:hypothetical protein